MRELSVLGTKTLQTSSKKQRKASIGGEGTSLKHRELLSSASINVCT